MVVWLQLLDVFFFFCFVGFEFIKNVMRLRFGVQLGPQKHVLIGNGSDDRKQIGVVQNELAI